MEVAMLFIIAITNCQMCVTFISFKLQETLHLSLPFVPEHFSSNAERNQKNLLVL